MIEEPIINDGKILKSQEDELIRYRAALDDAMKTNNYEEAERITTLLDEAKEQAKAGTEINDIIFKDSKRTLNAKGGIIQGVKNRGRR